MSARADRLHARPGPAPLSRPLAVDDVPDDGLDTAIEAEPAECAAVASQIGLPWIGALAARFHIARRPGGRLDVDGEIRAKVTQICVVSLEPFVSEIKQPIEISFAPRKVVPPDGGVAHGRLSRRRVEVPDMPPPPPTSDEDDPPDPIVEGRIDLGTVAVEFLTLGLSFYPKKPGVEFSETVVGETDAPTPSAFAALERLKDRS